MSTGFRITSFGVIGVVIVGALVMSGIYRNTLVRDSITSNPSNQTISLAGGKVTLEAPTDYKVTDANNNPKIYGVLVQNTKPGDENYASLLVDVWTGSMTDSQPSITKISNQASSVTPDNSLLPDNSPLITTRNTKVYIMKTSPTVQSSSLPEYNVDAHTQLNLRYSDGKTRPTVFLFYCESNNLGSSPVCHDLVKLALATLKISEPLTLPGITQPTQ